MSLFSFFKNIFGKKQQPEVRPAADDFEIAHNMRERERQQGIDRMLDKISAKGIDSLSKKERRILEGK